MSKYCVTHDLPKKNRILNTNTKCKVNYMGGINLIQGY